MKRLLAIAAILLGSLTAGAESLGPWFAPGGDCEAAIVQQINGATLSIHYQMYTFTSQPVADALIEAAGRGVEVTLLLDYRASLNPSCQGSRCSSHGCKVFVDSKHPIAHNKVRIIDGKILLAGSYNDSAQARHNAENLVYEDDPDTVAKYEANFQSHLAHAMTWRKSRTMKLTQPEAAE